MFRPLSFPEPYASFKDIFCLRLTRTVNGYRRISLFKEQIEVPNVLPYDEVQVHLIPHTDNHTVEIRIWCNDRLAHSVSYPLQKLHVHF